ncbi:MAG: heme exporter protein CcmB, partial [Alphaproteobacteria bacterium]|nr:heme exporter protein CcmB [Alphaproteobacteria bacterium]
MRAFLAILRRDMAVALAQGAATLLSVAFFVVTITLFPLGVGPDPATLARISSGVLWVAALLSVLLSLDRLFQA